MLCFLEICLAVLSQVSVLDVPKTAGYVTLMKGTPAVVFLAHNDLSGAEFYNLGYGDYIEYNGNRYIVREFVAMQATEPLNPAAALIDLEDGKKYTAKETWFRIYNHRDRLVLQTCIKKGNQLSWGRLFIVADLDTDYIYEQLSLTRK